MSFKRTTSGISNQYLFHNVDIVIYVEGGEKSFTLKEILGGACNDDSLDEIFWEKVFTNIKAKGKFKFKAVGSKTIIKDISIDIVNKNIRTALAAMDSEFDQVLDKTIKHSNVIYTSGYSWENDIWNADTIYDILVQITALKISRQCVKKNYRDFLKGIKSSVIADLFFFKKEQSFILRKGHLSCIDCRPSDLPSIKKEVIEQWFKDKKVSKSTINTYAKKYKIVAQKHCYGHLVADYGFQLIHNYIKNRHKIQGIHKNVINRMALNIYFDKYFKDSDSFKYYSYLLGAS